MTGPKRTTSIAATVTMTTTPTVGIFLTEDERRHLTNLCNELEARDGIARHGGDNPQARQLAALRKLMHLPAASAAAVEPVPSRTEIANRRAGRLDLDDLERLVDDRVPLASGLIACIRELRAGLADALYWLKPGLASQEDRAEEMARDRAELSKLLDKEIEIP